MITWISLRACCRQRRLLEGMTVSPVIAPMSVAELRVNFSIVLRARQDLEETRHKPVEGEQVRGAKILPEHV